MSLLTKFPSGFRLIDGSDLNKIVDILNGVATSPAGIAAGGVLSGTSTNTTGVNTQSVTTGITASTTQTRGHGQLSSYWNNVTTVANSGDAVTLPQLGAGQAVVVFNSDGTNAASVFPFGGTDTIDGGSGGAAVTLTHAKRCIYLCTAVTSGASTIISAQLGVASA